MIAFALIEKLKLKGMVLAKFFHTTDYYSADISSLFQRLDSLIDYLFDSNLSLFSELIQPGTIGTSDFVLYFRDLLIIFINLIDSYHKKYSYIE